MFVSFVSINKVQIDTIKMPPSICQLSPQAHKVTNKR